MKTLRAEISDAEAMLIYLRELRAENLETILRHGSLPSIEEQRAFIEEHSGKEGAIFVALENESIIGVLSVQRSSHSQLRHCCEFGIGVLKKYRGRGVGTKLIEEMESWCQSEGIERIELSVLRNNPGAISLYERLGFKLEGCKKGAVRIGSCYVDLLEMAKLTGSNK